MPKICVVTSAHASGEPRAPRHAVAISQARDDFDVLFIDCAAKGEAPVEPSELQAAPRVRRLTVRIPSRAAAPVERALAELLRLYAQLIFRILGLGHFAAFGPTAISLAFALRRERADIFIAHNIEALIPVARAAIKQNSKLIFDCMEFYSDMGGEQTKLERALAASVERKWLPKCDLILASSEELAGELTKIYPIKYPLVLYNTPEIHGDLPVEKKSTSFDLYWRNSTVALGQRGLDEALAALLHTPEGVVLHVQGRLPEHHRVPLLARIEELGVSNRVVIHAPFPPGDAVVEAAKYTVGLCLERSGCLNHELTVSNKIFDYLMGGLVVISSNLPGLRAVIDRSGGGLLFEPGSAKDLARQINRLYFDRSLLDQLRVSGRRFALTEGNRALTMSNFLSEFEQMICEL